MLLRRKAGQCLTTLFSGGNPFHFVSGRAYPDLTYAAENAVKAVVNIEVVQEIEVPERQYDPFFEFFGIPPAGPARPFDTGASGAEDPA